jgi:hypothetical protein
MRIKHSAGLDDWGRVTNSEFYRTQCLGAGRNAAASACDGDVVVLIRRREMAASISEHLAPQLQLLVLGGIFGDLYGTHAGQNLP